MSLRLFAALTPPADIAERLIALQRGVPGANWRPRENLHLTLCFFGDATEPVAAELDGELEAIGQAGAPFEIQLKGAGVFGKDEPHTLWIGAGESAALSRLAADCARAGRRLGLKLDARKYAPHVTMAYLNRPDVDRLAAFVQRNALFESRPWRVERFVLFSSWQRKSAPSLYRVEADYPLLG